MRLRNMDHNRYSKIYAYQGQTAQKYLNKKIFLIDKVLHEIFKRNRNIIKKLLRTPKLTTSTIT